MAEAKSKSKPAKKANPTPAAAKEEPKKREKAVKPVKAEANAVEAEILKVTKSEPQGKGEDFNTYAQRIAEAIDTTDGAWDKLSPAGQQWFADAAEASNAEKPLPPFPKAGKPKVEKAAKDDDGPAPAKAKKGAAKAAKEPKPAKAKTPKEPKERKKRTNHSVEVMIIACKDLTLDADTVVKEAKKEKIPLSESQMRGAYRLAHLVVDALRGAGILKK